MLRLHFLNVGNGDCIIVVHQDHPGAEKVYGLIDCNSANSSTSPALDRLLKLGAKKLSFVCITHPDRDHYSGIEDVLNYYGATNIAAFYTFPFGDERHVGQLARSYRLIYEKQDDKALKSRALEFLRILRFAYENFGPDKRWEQPHGYWSLLAPPAFDNVDFYCLLPPLAAKGPFFQTLKSGALPDEGRPNTNALSVAFLLSYRGQNIILGADATKESWRLHRRWQMRKSQKIGSNAVKMPHHGSGIDCDRDTIANLFDCEGEKIAVISADGQHHPSVSVLNSLIEAGVRPYCTNYCNDWGSNVTQLFTASEGDPELVRYLNELGRADLTHAQPCKGEIIVQIDDTGKMSVETEFKTACLCDPTFSSLFDASSSAGQGSK